MRYPKQIRVRPEARIAGFEVPRFNLETRLPASRNPILKYHIYLEQACKPAMLVWRYPSLVPKQGRLKPGDKVSLVLKYPSLNT